LDGQVQAHMSRYADNAQLIAQDRSS